MCEAVAGNFVAVTITDTGAGIDPEQLGRIFEPFFTIKGVDEGTGLDLSQVFGFAKQSGGDVHVQSEPGTGATSTLYLPSAYPDGPSIEVEEAAPAIGGNGLCVLVVEDNAAAGEFATTALQELGYDSVLALNAEDALAELHGDSSRFHVVFPDVAMPGMSGLDLGARMGTDCPSAGHSSQRVQPHSRPKRQVRVRTAAQALLDRAAVEGAPQGGGLAPETARLTGRITAGKSATLILSSSLRTNFR